MFMAVLLMMATLKLKCECAEILKECMAEQTSVMKRMASILEDVHSVLSRKSDVKWESSSSQDELSHEEEVHDQPSDQERASTSQQTNVLSTDSVHKVHPEGLDPVRWKEFTEFCAYADVPSVSKAGMEDEGSTVTTTPKHQDTGTLSILQSREDHVEDPVGEDVVVQEMPKSNPRIPETSSVEIVSPKGIDPIFWKKYTEIAGLKRGASVAPREQKRTKRYRYDWALNPEGACYIQEQMEKMAFSKKQSVRDEIYEGGVKRKLWHASQEMEQVVNYKIEQIYRKKR